MVKKPKKDVTMSKGNVKMDGDSNYDAGPFISTENFQYYSWAYRWYYQHLLPDVELTEDPVTETVIKTDPGTQNVGKRKVRIEPQTKQTLTPPRVNREPRTLSDVLKIIERSQRSSLSQARQLQYLFLCRSIKKDVRQTMTGARNNLFLSVAKEQTQFMAKAFAAAKEHVHLYEYLPKGADGYVKELLKNHFLRVYKYPRFYEVKDAIPLIGTNPSVQFKFLSKLLELGHSPRLILPKLKTKTNAQNYPKVVQQYPVRDDFRAGEGVLYKVPVSADPNAKTLANKHGACVVISSSALKQLADNFGPDFKDSWLVPITVCHSDTDSSGKKVVFVDKPLPRKEMNAYERNYWFHKYSLKAFLLHPQFKKAMNQDVPDAKRDLIAVEENEVFLDSPADLSDLEVFGVENSPQKDVRISAETSNKTQVSTKEKQANCAETSIQLFETTQQPQSSDSPPLECNASNMELDKLHITDDILSNDVDDSSSEISQLVIDEAVGGLNFQIGEKPMEIVDDSVNQSGLLSPRSTCSSDALCIDESYETPTKQNSSISSPIFISKSAAQETDETLTVKQEVKRGRRRSRSTSGAETEIKKKSKRCKNEDSDVDVESKNPAKQSTTPSKSDVDKDESKHTMVTRSRSRSVSASEMKSPNPQMCTRKKTETQEAAPVFKVEVESHLSMRDTLPPTPSSPDPEPQPTKKRLLLDVFGSSSSSEDEASSIVSESSVTKPSQNLQKPTTPGRLANGTKKEPGLLKSPKITVSPMDDNPLNRILADQEKMLQSSMKVTGNLANKTGVGISSTSLPKFSLENPNDYTQFAGDEQVEYNLFSLADMRLLVRSRVHGQTESIPKRRIKGERYTIFPKLEYQSHCGGEVLSPSEEVRQAVAVLIRPGSKVVQARVDAYSSEVLAVSTRGLEEYSIQSQAAVDMIYTLLQKLPHLPAGNFLLRHTRNEGFATILKQAEVATKDSFDLHSAYSYVLSEEPPPIAVAPWLPIDPSVFFWHHRKRIPATFMPASAYNKPKKKQKKCKQIRKPSSATASQISVAECV